MKSYLCAPLALALCAAITHTACDAPASDDACPEPARMALARPLDAPPIDDEDITPRQAPIAQYIQTWNAQPIQGKQFCEAVLSCADVEDPGALPGDPGWLLTLSADDLDPTSNRLVLGLGGSAYVSSQLAGCYQKQWQGNGAIDL